MVSPSGAQGRAGRIRPLNRPRPVRVEVDEEERPVAVWLSPERAGIRLGRRHAVEVVLETWRIDDEWWRERPVSRLYFRLLLEDGRSITVYRDLVNDRWARQTY